jgi:aminoglycoside 3-N-acetyltransferase
MSLFSLYNKIVSISPYLEVFVRKIYWHNISRFSKFKSATNKNVYNSTPVNFESIKGILTGKGILKGSIIIVHSSYDLLESSGLSPEEINSKLLELVGPEGTLVMPAIRKYKEEGKLEEYLTKNIDDIICTYNVRKSRVISGVLPYSLMQRPDSKISRFPLNPVVAVGKQAEKMIEKNLDGINQSAHGPNSAWKYCADNNAVVIGLGIDMAHYLTITHVNEECDTEWPIKNWYRKRKFNIIDRDFTIQKEVLERKPIWGTIYLAENRFRRDLLKNNILKVERVGNLDISIIESRQLMNFLHNHPHKGYPYYVRQGNKN